jgi:hypothetical protein
MCISVGKMKALVRKCRNGYLIKDAGKYIGERTNRIIKAWKIFNLGL